MTETQSAPRLRELSDAATAGPWFADAEKSDGSYGSGEDTSEGYDTAVIMTEAETRYGKPGVLFESHNSTVGMIHEESDDEWFRAWDAVSAANAAFIVALVNAFRAGRLIDPTTLTEAVAAARAEGVREGLERALEAAKGVRKDYRPVLSKSRYQAHEIQQFFGGGCGLVAEDIQALLDADLSTTPGGRTDG